MEKKIYLTEGNKAKVQALLDGIQKRSRVRTVTADDIYEAAESLEAKLNIPKKHLEGITAWVDPNAQSFPNAYKYIPYSTSFKLGRMNNKWALLCCGRYECQRKSFYVNLTDKAKESIVNNYGSFDS